MWRMGHASAFIIACCVKIKNQNKTKQKTTETLTTEDKNKNQKKTEHMLASTVETYTLNLR